MDTVSTTRPPLDAPRRTSAPVRRLPARLYEARSARVLSQCMLLAEIDLGFGCLAQRTLYVEGVDHVPPPGELGDRANHCMVVLLGGKKLLLQISDFPIEGPVQARVFLDEHVYGHANLPGLTRPYGIDELMLDVGEFYRYLGRNRFNVALVKQAISERARGRCDTRREPVITSNIDRAKGP